MYTHMCIYMYRERHCIYIYIYIYAHTYMYRCLCCTRRSSCGSASCPGSLYILTIYYYYHYYANKCSLYTIIIDYVYHNIIKYVIYLSLSLYIYIYMSIHTYIHISYIYIYTHRYIYIYIYREREIHKYTQPCDSDAFMLWMAGRSLHLDLRSKQRDPNPKDNSLTRKQASTYKRFSYTCLRHCLL